MKNPIWILLTILIIILFICYVYYTTEEGFDQNSRLTLTLPSDLSTHVSNNSISVNGITYDVRTQYSLLNIDLSGTKLSFDLRGESQYNFSTENSSDYNFTAKKGGKCFEKYELHSNSIPFTCALNNVTLNGISSDTNSTITNDAIINTQSTECNAISSTGNKIIKFLINPGFSARIVFDITKLPNTTNLPLQLFINMSFLNLPNLSCNIGEINISTLPPVTNILTEPPSIQSTHQSAESPSIQTTYQPSESQSIQTTSIQSIPPQQTFNGANRIVTFTPSIPSNYTDVSLNYTDVSLNNNVTDYNNLIIKYTLSNIKKEGNILSFNLNATTTYIKHIDQFLYSDSYGNVYNNVETTSEATGYTYTLHIDPNPPKLLSTTMYLNGSPTMSTIVVNRNTASSNLTSPQNQPQLSEGDFTVRSTYTVTNIQFDISSYRTTLPYGDTPLNFSFSFENIPKPITCNIGTINISSTDPSNISSSTSPTSKSMYTSTDNCCVSFQTSSLLDNSGTIIFKDPTNKFTCEISSAMIYYGLLGESDYLSVSFRATGPDPRENHDINATTITTQTGSNPEQICTNKWVPAIGKPYQVYSDISPGLVTGTLNFQLLDNFKNFNIGDTVKLYYNSWCGLPGNGTPLNGITIGSVIPFNGVKTSQGAQRVNFSGGLYPSDMPEWEIFRIENEKCPPPMLPIAANQKIMMIKNASVRQKKQVDYLEQYIADIESRYKIFFSIGQVSRYNDTAQVVKPTINITGTVQHPTIQFNILGPAQGENGPNGKRGPDGPRGDPGTTGIVGKTGFWGNKG